MTALETDCKRVLHLRPKTKPMTKTEAYFLARNQNKTTTGMSFLAKYKDENKTNS